MSVEIPSPPPGVTVEEFPNHVRIMTVSGSVDVQRATGAAFVFAPGELGCTLLLGSELAYVASVSAAFHAAWVTA